MLRLLQWRDIAFLSLGVTLAGMGWFLRRLVSPAELPLLAAANGTTFAMQGLPPGSSGYGRPGNFGPGAPGPGGNFGPPSRPGNFGPPQPPPPIIRKPGGGLIIPNVKPAEKAPADEGSKLAIPNKDNFTGILPPPEQTDIYEGATYLPPSRDEVSGMTEEEMVAIIRSRSQPWYDLSKYMQALMRLGVSPNKIYDATGIPPLDQSLWHVQSLVYQSLVENPDFPREKLAYFGNPQLTVLSELRELTDEERPEIAEYCVDRRLTAMEARELARACRLLKLFPKEAQGFTEHPGDKLAFKYWRTGIEFQKSDPDACKEACALALKYVHSEGARARIEALLEGKLQGSLDALEAQSVLLKAVQARLQVIRLGAPETHWRCVPVLGPLDDITEANLQSAPLAAPTGVFKTFRPVSTYAWMTIPNWPEVQGVAQPCMVEIRDPASMRDYEDLAAMTGPCMLLVSVGTTPATAEHYYLATKRSALAGVNSALQLVSGGTALSSPDWVVHGRVLLAVQPQ